MASASLSITAAWVLVPSGLLVAALAYGLSRLAVARGYLPDRPTPRSNHQIVTPRSGGVALVLAFIVGMGVAAAAGAVSGVFALDLVAIAFLAFAMGFADDLASLSPVWKFAGQFAAAALFLVLFGALESGPVPGAGEIPLGAAGAALTVLWIVGFMNAYNFMDGVNGIAAACGVFALAALAAAAAFAGAPMVAVASGLAAAALLGFLPVNFPGGRLFMGDGGSQATGLLIAALALLAAKETDGRASALFAPTVMAPFLFDVAFTLVHRAARRRDILAAHSEHLYQLLTRLGASHALVTAAYVALTGVSAAVAFVMLRADPALQWMGLAALWLMFLAPAAAVFRRARAAGLLAEEEAIAFQSESGQGPSVARAAE